MYVKRTFPESALEARLSSYRVEAPRASDAIGFALRNAFNDDSGLPDDMAAMLRKLNQTKFVRSH